MGVLPDHLGGAGDLLGRGVGAELQGAGVDAQQRQPVAEDVVHLAGDLVTGPLLGLLGPQMGLGLGPHRAVAQRQHELAPVVDEQAPADRGALDHDAEQEQGDGGHPGLGAHHHVDERGQDAQRVDPRRCPRGSVDRDREQRHHHGPGHRLREGREGHQRQGEPDRPAAAQPQRQAAERPGDLVEVEQPGRLHLGGRLQPICGRQQPGQHRQQEQQGVHDPVARPAPGSRRRRRPRSVHPGSVPARGAGSAAIGQDRYRSHRGRYFRRARRSRRPIRRHLVWG